ncbi:hypothetical protein CKM354_001038500 [Cercospora kikuchii]|uniref:RNase III domain-containing protein n=1 Tax=Cercospora kikuchii TaxID=84275 RepID=A0A9P3CWV2_9PEZI|nr:uncharacterized protein CKM354_001038500 [Cercospora kikuchii]GIZ47290.1 hypothetical protein CKM354_001038500 [Cercospora kikuchii]
MSFPNKVHQAHTFVLTYFDYDVSKLDLLYEAIDTSGLTGRQSNKRLALVGDGALDMAMKAAWYRTGEDKGGSSMNWLPRHKSDHATGVCSTWLSQLSNSRLAMIARWMELGTYLILNPGHRGVVSEGTLATSLEAIIGAIYIDCGENISTIETVMRTIAIDMPDPVTN